MWRQETQASQELGQLKDEFTKCEQSLRSVTGRPILQGIESIQSILKQFEAAGTNEDVVKGYHGLLIDNIECDRSLFTAVETSVTSRLFYHIVDTDIMAMKLLKTMNQQKLHGEVNYLPLNVLKLEADVNYPDTNDAMPLIRNLKYDKKVEKAVRHVFDKILLCRNVEAASRLAKESRMDCVVLDGDFVSRKGALTGGYVDTRQSKLAYYRQRAELAEKIKQKEADLATVEKEIRDVDAQLNTVLNDLQKYETRVKRNRDTYEQMRADMNSRKLEIERFERQRPQKDSSIESLRLDIEQLESKRDMLKAELGTELVKQVSADEQKVVDELNDRVHKLNTELKEILSRRMEIESQKLEKDNQLKNNLLKKRDDLLQELEANKLQQRTSKIDMYKQELELINDRIETIESKLKLLNKQLTDLNKSEITALDRELEKLQEAERRMQDELQESTVELEKVSTKLSILLKKKDECLKASRNLGALPQEAYLKYQVRGPTGLLWALIGFN